MKRSRYAQRQTLRAWHLFLHTRFGDGQIGVPDLAILLSSWGPCAGCPADLNGDEKVDSIDLATLLSNWGSCP